MRLGGPKLKMPDLSAARSKLPGGSGSKAGSTLKAPAFLTDLYYDLRDRRLLWPLALVLVAIAAVPFLLGSKPKPVPAPPAGGIAAAVGGEGVSKLTVVEAQPGLREYSKRLKRRSPSDPFQQHYTGLPPAAQVEATQGAGGGSESSGEAVTVTESTTTEVSETGSSGSGSGGGGSSGGSGGGSAPNPQGSGVRLYEFVLDVQISHAEPTADGARKMSEPQVRHGVKSLAQLPGKKRPVVTVGGVNLHNGKVFFLVSDQVRSLDGEFTCLTRAPGGLCELLELEPGFPLEATYGAEEIAYRIKVTRIDTAWAGHAGDKKGSKGKGGKGAAQGSAAEPRASFGADRFSK